MFYSVDWEIYDYFHPLLKVKESTTIEGINRQIFVIVVSILYVQIVY